MNIYLDNNATTPLDPKACIAMQEEFANTPLNPSSVHSKGQSAKMRLHAARKTTAKHIGCLPSEIIFTSCATEALNWLIFHFAKTPCHIISTSIEHAAIHESLQVLEDTHKITYLSCSQNGTFSIEALKASITDETKLLVFSSVNSETGAMHDIKSVAQIAQEHDIPLVVDGVALLGKAPIEILDGISAMVFSAHKAHGPKGCGFFYLNKVHSLSPLFYGGGQENGLRGGTENLSAIIGLATALETYQDQAEKTYLFIKELRDTFESLLLDKLQNISINCPNNRIGNVSNICFHGVDAETLLIALDQAGVCASHGSACSSGSLEPSRILLNIGLSYAEAKSSIRFSFSRMNTLKEVQEACNIITSLVMQIRALEKIEP